MSATLPGHAWVQGPGSPGLHSEHRHGCCVQRLMARWQQAVLHTRGAQSKCLLLTAVC